MSDADRAYGAARSLIAKANSEGAEWLSLDSDETRALTLLPPEIASLNSLRVLDLSNTGVTDLSPLAGLTALTTLALNNTGVTDLMPISRMLGLRSLLLGRTGVTDLSPISALSRLTRLDLDESSVIDLRPILGLTRLTRAVPKTSDWARFGVSFRGSAAARINPRIAKIAEIEHPAQRAHALFDYLRSEEATGSGDSAKEEGVSSQDLDLSSSRTEENFIGSFERRRKSSEQLLAKLGREIGALEDRFSAVSKGTIELSDALSAARGRQKANEEETEKSLLEFRAAISEAVKDAKQAVRALSDQSASYPQAAK